MKSRKFEIEWQQYKTLFKNHLPAKDAKSMKEKMVVAYDLFQYFMSNRSYELGYNVVNWLDGLVIAFKKDDERRSIIESAIEEIKGEWQERSSLFSGTPEKEPDASFGYEAIKSFIETGYSNSDFYTDYIGYAFDWDLFFENMIHNLDMLNKWLKKSYKHNDGIQYIVDCAAVAEDFDQDIPAKVQRRLDKASEELERIETTGAESEHKFLY